MAGYASGMSGADQKLFMAAKNGSIKHAVEALALGARAGAIDADGETPLHALAACLREPCDVAYCEFAKVLIDAGCLIETEDRFGYTALTRAAYCNNEALVSALHLRGARLDGSLHFLAAHSDSTQMANLLLTLGYDIFSLDGKGLSVLEAAQKRWGGRSMKMVSFIEGAILSAHAPSGENSSRAALRI